MVDSRIRAVALFCAAAVLLTGCAPEEPSSQIRRILAAESGPEDVLPTELQDVLSDPESSRLVGEYAGVGYFVTKYLDPDSGRPGFCLVLSKPSEGAVTGCGSDDNPSRMRVGGTGTGSARVVVADDIVPDGWTKLGDFLIVNPYGSG